MSDMLADRELVSQKEEEGGGGMAGALEARLGVNRT